VDGAGDEEGQQALTGRVAVVVVEDHAHAGRCVADGGKHLGQRDAAVGGLGEDGGDRGVAQTVGPDLEADLLARRQTT
jgi:hypothetical protein